MNNLFRLEKPVFQGKLTDELRLRIQQCWESIELEDIYLPYKPHRKTRADVAREQGWEPLAIALFAQKREGEEAIKQLGEKREEALQGARDIIAEWISQDERARNNIRREFSYSAIISTKVVKGKESDTEAQKYKDYFAVSEPLRRISSLPGKPSWRTGRKRYSLRIYARKAN